MAAKWRPCVSSSRSVLGRPKPRPRRQFSHSQAKAQQTCYTALMNLTQCPPINPMTPTMSTCSEEKPAKSPPAVCAVGTGKKSTRASHGAPTPPSATPAAKNATTTAKPAPPAAQKKTCAANAYLDLPSKNQSHRLCRKLCRKHQNAPFSKNCAPFSRKTAAKRHPRCPVTKDRINVLSRGKKNQGKFRPPLTTFASIRYPIDTLPVCPQPPAMEATASRPGQSWARPAQPAPRAAAPPAKSCSSSSTTVCRADMLHCAPWPQVRFSAPGSQECIPHLGRPQGLVSDSSVASQRLSETHPRFELHPQKKVNPRLLSHCHAPFQPASNDLLPGNQAIAAYPVSPQIPQILIQTTIVQESGMHHISATSNLPPHLRTGRKKGPLSCGQQADVVRFHRLAKFLPQRQYLGSSTVQTDCGCAQASSPHRHNLPVHQQRRKAQWHRTPNRISSFSASTRCWPIT